jgi:hypothetical protein
MPHQNSGVFASWQPRYAEHGIPTFPVRFDGKDKRPCVRGYLTLGLPSSQQLPLKFPANDAFGFSLRRARITVLDVDTADERVRDDAFAIHGTPAIVVRSVSGNWQGWYRHNGEARTIRPWPDRPVDVLGDGYVVAPPSRGPGGEYQFVQGGLDDLDRLTTLRNVALPARSCAAGSDLIREGLRGNAIWRYCMRQARHCDDLEALVDVARTFAEEEVDMTGTTHAVTDAGIRRAAASAWKYEIEDRNLFDRGGAILTPHTEFDALVKEPTGQDALILLMALRRNHWGRPFILANAMAKTFGWGPNRFKAARDCLVKHSTLRCIHRGGRGPHDAPWYRLTKGI